MTGDDTHGTEDASSRMPGRGEYNAIAAMPGTSHENSDHYGWHGLRDGSDEEPHADPVTNVRKEKHPFDAGHRARKGTEY